MTVQASRGTYVSDPNMYAEEENAELSLLHHNVPSSMDSQVMYKLLLEHLQRKRLERFERCVEQCLSKRPASIDLNYAYPDQMGQTLLHIACKKGFAEFVKFLLKNGARVNEINEHHGGPIHLATEYSHYDVLRILLDEPTINPNLQRDNETALHIAVKKRHLKCAELLLEKGASPNISNGCFTALHYAAYKNQKDTVKLILEKSTYTVDLDCWEYNGQTTREVLKEKMPDITLPAAVRRTPNVYDLKTYLINNDEENFLKCYEEVQADLGDDVVGLIETAVQRKLKSPLDVLLDKARSVNCNLQRAAYHAVQLGSPDILSQLLDENIEDTSDLLIDACVELGIPHREEKGRADDRLTCLKLLLRRDVDVRCTDSKGNTPLHYAARAGCNEAVTLLLAKGSYIGQMNKFNVPPIADMSASTLSKHFDECIRLKESGAKEYTIEFNYRCLMPHGASHRKGKQKSSISPEMGEMDIVQFIADKGGLRDVLMHPLLSSFLYLKWHRIRYILCLNFVFYVLFCLCLDSYILRAVYTNNSKVPANSSEYAQVEPEGSSSVILLRIAAGLATSLLAAREILQLLSSPCHYLSSFENWIEMALIALGFAVLWDVNVQIAAVAILLSTWELVILIGKYPRMSTAIEMFKTVTINFMRFLLPYALLIVAFALIFFVLFKDADEEQKNFPDIWHSMFKTIIMLTGELEAADIPFVSHPILSHIIFVFFVFLIPIVLFNLLNGLAVSDTANILSKAELVGLVSRVRVLAYIENIATGAPFVHGRYCIPWNGLLRNCNPLAYFARKVLLFPSYLDEGKLSVKEYDSLNPYGNNLRYVAQSTENTKYKVLPVMDPQVMKRVRDILSRKDQETINERLVDKLESLNEGLEAIKHALNSIERKLENKN